MSLPRREPGQAGQSSVLFENFGDPLYWETCFKEGRYGDSFEWLQPYCGLRDLLLSVLQYPRKQRILHVGCGNSTLGVELFQEGYPEVINIDISGEVIRKMSAKYKKLAADARRGNSSKGVSASPRVLEFLQMDCKSLEYGSQSFDFLVDKGTLDALLCSERREAEAKDYVVEIARVLKTGGKAVVMSSGSPSSRLPLLEHVMLDVSSDSSLVSPLSEKKVYAYVLTRRENPRVTWISLKKWELMLKKVRKLEDYEEIIFREQTAEQKRKKISENHISSDFFEKTASDKECLYIKYISRVLTEKLNAFLEPDECASRQKILVIGGLLPLRILRSALASLPRLLKKVNFEIVVADLLPPPPLKNEGYSSWISTDLVDLEGCDEKGKFSFVLDFGVFDFFQLLKVEGEEELTEKRENVESFPDYYSSALLRVLKNGSKYKLLLFSLPSSIPPLPPKGREYFFEEEVFSKFGFPYVEIENVEESFEGLGGGEVFFHLSVISKHKSRRAISDEEEEKKRENRSERRTFEAIPLDPFFSLDKVFDEAEAVSEKLLKMKSSRLVKSDIRVLLLRGHPWKGHKFVNFLKKVENNFSVDFENFEDLKNVKGGEYDFVFDLGILDSFTLFQEARGKDGVLPLALGVREVVRILKDSGSLISLGSGECCPKLLSSSLSPFFSVREVPVSAPQGIEFNPEWLAVMERKSKGAEGRTEKEHQKEEGKLEGLVRQLPQESQKKMERILEKISGKLRYNSEETTVFLDFLEEKIDSFALRG